MSKAQTFIFHRAQALASDSRRKKLKPEITAWVEKGGVVEDETTGHIVRRFPAGRTVPDGGKVYVGFELRRSPGAELIDPDMAEALATELGLLKQVTHRETVWDYDNFAVLLLQGRITQAQFDGLWVKGEDRYALWPLQADDA